MKIGTKTLLFGLHQFMLHPALMLIAYIKVFKTCPSLLEIVAIIVHDWGYFGKEGIDSKGGEYHPYLGAKICRLLFGPKGWDFCIGHNDEVRLKEGVARSRLYTVDKYYYILIPVWLHRLLGDISGESLEIAERGNEWNPRAYKEEMVFRFKSSEIITY